ncbi:MAG: hypothetical protein BroJett022_07810 [Actinomycetes bacterium]|nr:MAG: hypothetical protein BroJett022_07810 [Actinomycetes bacterium]
MRGRSAAAGLLAASVLAAGCGAEEFPNDPRPPAPVELSAKVDDRKVTVVPDEVGAGLATFTISNQSRDGVELAFDGPSDIRTDVIPAGGVGAVQFELEPGTYEIEAGVPTIADGAMTVGPERPSASNELLLP